MSIIDRARRLNEIHKEQEEDLGKKGMDELRRTQEEEIRTRRKQEEETARKEFFARQERQEEIRRRRMEEQIRVRNELRQRALELARERALREQEEKDKITRRIKEQYGHFLNNFSIQIAALPEKYRSKFKEDFDRQMACIRKKIKKEIKLRKVVA